MNEDRDYRAALVLGLRRASMHWLRAGYEVVAGWGAIISEVAEARRDDMGADEDERDDEGPVRIELDD